jgi:sulfur carrier protein
MHAMVNGERRELAEGTTVEALLRSLGIVERNGVAVAINERVVPGGTFDRAALRDGDAVEIIRAVAGG